MFQSILNLIFPEKAFFWGYAEKIARSVTGPISIFFVVIFLDLKSQGYLFTFISLLTIKFVLELGLTQIIITFVAYEKNSLNIKKNFLKGRFNNYLRLKNISRYAIIWFFWASLIYIGLLNLVGFILFNSAGDPYDFWLPPFLLLCVFSAIEIFFIPFYAVKEGLAKIDEVYQYRFYKTILFLIAYLALLSIGADIWSYSAALFINVIVDFIFVMKNKSLFISLIRTVKGQVSRLNWKTEIFPMQSRIAIGSISGVLSFSIFTPFSFSLLGPETAGKVGLTVAIVTGISTLSVVPSMVSSQKIASLVEQKNIGMLDNLILRLLALSFAIHIFSLLILIALFYSLEEFFPFILEKVLDPKSFLLFFFAMMFSLISTPLSIFMRAHKEEPLMWLSIFTGVFICFGSYFGMYLYGAIGAALTFFMVTFLSFPILILIFFKFRSRY